MGAVDAPNISPLSLRILPPGREPVLPADVGGIFRVAFGSMPEDVVEAYFGVGFILR